MKCPKPVRGCAADFVQLQCGKPIEDSPSYLALDSFIRISFTPVLTEGTEIVVEDAQGRNCVDEPACRQLRRYDVSIELCGLAPEQTAWFSGDRFGYNTAGNPYAVFGKREDCPPYFSMRVWQELAKGRKVCTPEGDELFFVHHLACVTDLMVDSAIEVANGATNVTLSGKAFANDGTYGTGPFDSWDIDWYDEEIYGYQVEPTPKPTENICEIVDFPGPAVVEEPLVGEGELVGAGA